jgi:hypothetical protein
MAVAPSITTTAAFGITPYSAVAGGYLVSDGGAGLSLIGTCWGTSINPTCDLEATYHDGTNANGILRSSLTNLLPNTLYHFRAYAANSIGLTYGADMTFTTTKLYYTTITFPVQNINETETIQLTIKFAHSSDDY